MGRWELRRGPDAVTTTPAVQRLTALLALEGRRERSWVMSRLWPECTEYHARGNLRSAIWRVKQMHPGLVASSGGAVALGGAVSVDVDRILRQARSVLRGDEAPADAVAVLSSGDLLPGWYDNWVVASREPLRQLQLRALERLASVLARDGQYLEALQAGLAAVRMDPLRESAYRVVARVHLAEGNVGEAVRQFRLCEQMLAHEFGIGPTRQFRDLMAPILGTLAPGYR